MQFDDNDGGGPDILIWIDGGGGSEYSNAHSILYHIKHSACENFLHSSLNNLK